MQGCEEPRQRLGLAFGRTKVTMAFAPFYRLTDDELKIVFAIFLTLFDLTPAASGLTQDL